MSFLKEKRWSSGKEAVNAVKLHAFQLSKCAMVHTRGEMFGNSCVVVLMPDVRDSLISLA